MTDDILDRVDQALDGTTPEPWFWAGNTDHDGDVELRGRMPGMGHVDVLRTCFANLDEQELGARFDAADREYGLGSYISREEYIERETDHPRRYLALGRPDGLFVELARELAVYEVARNQGLPDDTPRDHPKVYRGDVVDVRNPNARFIATSRSLVVELADALRAARTENEQLRKLAKVVEHFIGERPDYLAYMESRSQPDTDYWRWQGHAEARQTLSALLPPDTDDSNESGDH